MAFYSTYLNHRLKIKFSNKDFTDQSFLVISQYWWQQVPFKTHSLVTMLLMSNSILLNSE